ncbi:retrovirus-related pol polyprotein from transposon TNT 1-94 [Tanacetum coccineum]
MSGAIPPIPPPFGASSGTPSSPNANRVDTMPTTSDPINTTTMTNLAQSEDFTSWKVRLLVFLDGLEPYLLKTLEDGPFVSMSSLSTTKNPLPKRQNQWSNAESRLANQDKRLKSIIISYLLNDVMKSVVKCKTAKEVWNDLILAHEGPCDTRDTKIAALRLKFNAFKSLEGEKIMGTFTRLKCLLNDLENNGVTIPQAEVNATFVNSLPRKWLSMNQTQRANNFIKNDSLATLYGKYNYEEGLINQIYESETQRFLIQTSSSKALISNTQFQDSDSDVKEDQRTSNEFMADLNAEYHERALLANKKRFYKRSGRVGSARKPIDKTKETCFACGKTRHFRKDCPSNKTSTPSYPSLNNSFNKFKSYTPLINQTSSHNTESVSSEDEGTTRIRAFMAIAEDEPSVGKADARSNQWLDITMKKVIKKWTCSKVTLDQLLSEQIPGNIIKALGGKGWRKENNPSKEVMFSKANVSTSKSTPMINSDSEDDSDIQEPLPPLLKLTGADPSGASKSLILLSDLTANMAYLTLNTAFKEIKKIF